MLRTYEVPEDAFYLFACAEIKEREKEFVDKGRIERMLNAGSIEEFNKILQETHYSQYVSELEKTRSFDFVMMTETKTNVEYLRNRLKDSDQPLKEIFLLQIDLHNVKLMMKASVLDREMKDLFIPVNCTYDTLKAAFDTGEIRDIDPETAALLTRAKELMTEEQDQRIRELKLEQDFIDSLYSSISGTGNEMLTELFRHMIDIYNIKNIFRAKHTNETFDYDVFLYEHGFLEKAFLSRFEKESVDYFVQVLERTEYVKMLFQGTQLFHTENTFSAFERNEDQFILNFFEQVKYNVAGIEKVAQFMMRKRIELHNLNIIYNGILYKADKHRIRNRIALL